MMYWIVFALFTCAETFTDVFLSWCVSRQQALRSISIVGFLYRFPFYYEIKIILVIWLLSPATKGSSILYRKFVHPMLSSREQVRTKTWICFYWKTRLLALGLNSTNFGFKIQRVELSSLTNSDLKTFLIEHLRFQEIDEYISKAKEQSYRQVLDLGSKGVNVLMQTALKVIIDANC